MIRCWKSLFALVAGGVLALSSAGLTQEAASQEATGAPALLSAAEMEVLVSRIAFHPDEVIAITLPASTYPLDIVKAARLLEQRNSKPDAQPDPNWDPSVIALLNYPVVIGMMNDDLEWTTALGEAVLAQQADVMDAIQQVRKSAYTAGYLQSNDKTVVVYEQDVVQIQPADPQVVYVPVYEPAPPPPPATTTVVQTPVYYPTTVVYSEPYTPYYNQAAAFWTGAIVGGLTMGFLMDWGDDDIDIDINDGDWDGWRPGWGGDTDIDIERGDINIGGDVNIGNDIKIGKGDSWRQVRARRTGAAEATQLQGKRAKTQPAASLNTQRQRTAVTQPVAGAPTAKAKRPRTAESKRAPAQPTAFGNVERGQDAVKAKKRGANSRQVQQTGQPKTKAKKSRTTQPVAGATGVKPKPKRSGGEAFGGIASGSQTKQFTNRGSSSQKKRIKKR